MHEDELDADGTPLRQTTGIGVPSAWIRPNTTHTTMHFLHVTHALCAAHGVCCVWPVSFLQFPMGPDHTPRETSTPTSLETTGGVG